jgi:hypothetical protein
MPPIDKNRRSQGLAPVSGQAGEAPAVKKKRASRLAPEPMAEQTASLSAPAPSKLKKIVKHDAFTVAAGKAPKSVKSVPIGLAVINKSASQTTKTVAAAIGAGQAVGVKTAGRVMGGAAGGMKALSVFQLGVELQDTRRVAKEDRADFKLFKTLMGAFDPAVGKVKFELGASPAGLDDPDAKLAELSAKPGFLDAYVKGEGLSKERVVLLKKVLITSAESTSGIASAAGSKWVPFLGTAIEGAKFVDGTVKVQGGVTALNNLRGAIGKLDGPFEGMPAEKATKLKELLQGLGKHVERERLIKGSKDLAMAAAAGAAFGAGLAVAVGTAGIGLAIAQPALGIGSAAVDIATSIRDAKHKANLESLRDPGKIGDATGLYASEGVVDYGTARNIGLTEKTVLHLLAEGTQEEKKAIRDFLGELGISEKRLLAIALHAEIDPSSAMKHLQEALYKDRLSSTQSMSWGLVGNSLKSVAKMMTGLFKGWTKEPRNPPTTEAADRVSLAAPSGARTSIVNLIDRNAAEDEPLLDFLSRISARRNESELFRAGSTLSEGERRDRLEISSERLEKRMSWT